MQISYLMVESRIISESGKGSIWRIALLSIIYFFYIYSFQFQGFLRGVLYYRLAVVLLFLYTCIVTHLNAVRLGKSCTSRNVKKYLIWNVFLFIYVSLILVVYGQGDGISAVPSYVNMIIVLPLFYISGKYIFHSVEEVLTILYVGCIIQAIIIIAATLEPTLQTALKLFYVGSLADAESLNEIERMTSGGYNIGFQCFTSQGSLKMSMGVLGACYFLMKTNGRKFLFHLLIYLLITFASSLLSRTGLFISFFCLFVVLVNKVKQGTKGLATAILILFISCLVFEYIIGNFSSNKYLSEYFVRFSSLFSSGVENSYFVEWKGEGVGGNVVPPLSYNTLIGLGIKQGTSGAGIQTVVDGGFLINYSSMGLIMAIANYLIIFSFLGNQYRRTNNRIYKSLVAIMFIILIMGEIKEHFVYQMYFVSFMFVIFFLLEKEEKKAMQTR